MTVIARAGYPARAVIVEDLLTEGRKLFEYAHRLRVLLKILDETLLVGLIQVPEAIEECRGDRHDFVGRRGGEPIFELTDVRLSHHGELLWSSAGT